MHRGQLSAALAFAAFACVLPAETPGPRAERREREVPRITLQVRLTLPDEVLLTWTSREWNPAGFLPEFGTEMKDDDFVNLAYLPADQTSHTHGRVVADTFCHYRVRAYFGPVSNEVTVTTGVPLRDDEPMPVPDSWCDPVKVPQQRLTPQSIRAGSPAIGGAPLHFKASLAHPTGILFTWIERASDEDGYLLEVQETPLEPFRVCARIPPDVNSYGYAQQPGETTATYRIRAFYRGAPSNVVVQRTPPRE